MSEQPATPPHFYTFQVSGGSAGHGFRTYYLNDTQGHRIGWIVVANSRHSYSGGPSFDEHTEYWYLDVDLSTVSAFTVVIDSEGDWPSTWSLPSTAQYAWTAPNTNVRYTWRNNANPTADTWFTPSSGASPKPSYWGWSMPTSSADGSANWWASAQGPYFDGDVGDSWNYRSDSAPRDLSAYNHIDAIPEQ